MRIVSTLPSATEIVYCLGLGKELVGVSHECRFPRSVNKKPRISETDFDYTNAGSRQIDNYVSDKMHNHHSLYKLKRDLLIYLSPTHLITQKLCDVCSITPSDVQKVIYSLAKKPQLITLDPTSLEDIINDILMVGKVLSREKEALGLAGKLRSKIEQIKLITKNYEPKTVFCVEWIDPPYASGHWIPEMVGIAGGKEVLGLATRPSRKVSWEEVVNKDPQILIFMPCGFNLSQAKNEIQQLNFDILSSLNAVKNSQIWLVDGSSYFNQSGPRVIECGLEILAKIIHPEIFGFPSEAEAVNIQPSVIRSE